MVIEAKWAHVLVIIFRNVKKIPLNFELILKKACSLNNMSEKL